MKIARTFGEFAGAGGSAVVAAGFFDGIHRGHAKVLEAAVADARASGAAPWVLTFDRHPFELLAPERAPRLLASVERRLELVEGFGFEGCLLLPFTRELAALPPRDFVERLAAPRCPGTRVASLHCGGNWTFGSHAAGTPSLLRALGAEFGFRTEVARALRCSGDCISSTRIRNAVASGDLALAERMLGRPHSVEGVVGHGREVGRALGRPTANLEPGYSAAMPPDGVYAVRAFDGKNGAPLPGVANIGVRPTFAGEGGAPLRTFEIHLLDFVGDLYGRRLRVEFARFLRPERAFPSASALSAQIACDAAAARRILS